jgi:hypothetical protein
MSPRKSSQIADSPSLPTIKDYFDMMAEGQKNDIRRLKQAAAGKNSEQPNRRPADGAVPDPWLLHPNTPVQGGSKAQGKKRRAVRCQGSPRESDQEGSQKGVEEDFEKGAAVAFSRKQNCSPIYCQPGLSGGRCTSFPSSVRW